MANISDCKIVKLPVEDDPRGNLTYIYENKHIPFNIKRVFYIYDVPEGENRGAHAHKQSQQFIIAVAGHLKVFLSDGTNSSVVLLDKPYEGLLVPVGVWAHEQDFSKECVCLVLTDTEYSEDDYIRNYDQYLEYLKNK